MNQSRLKNRERYFRFGDFLKARSQLTFEKGKRFLQARFDCVNDTPFRQGLNVYDRYAIIRKFLILRTFSVASTCCAFKAFQQMTVAPFAASSFSF